jgi:hypothetical protein
LKKPPSGGFFVSAGRNGTIFPLALARLVLGQSHASLQRNPFPCGGK